MPDEGTINIETIRMVVWDLDDTLWQGTLSEGDDIVHDHAIYDLIRDLTRRGIVNSICSRNDFGTVQTVLSSQGIWEEFIFPSIDWTSKGPRLQRLITSVQLRPESVLFIDDNASNLGEATASVPGIQVASPLVIKGLLQDPRMQGKADPECSRLAHYKALEARHTQQLNFEGDNLSFLRASQIEIELEYDIEAHLDRAIELINRTNQLNFTKRRLPQDPALAANALVALVSRYDVKAALIRVSDRYGEHGICGIYVVEGANAWAKLVHFCFSCRIMGLGVEQKVYELIGRPQLNIVGNVAAELSTSGPLDWLSIREAKNGRSGHGGTPRLGEVRLRGGCDLDGVGHYFSHCCEKLTVETNYIREHLFFRSDSTVNLLQEGDNGEPEIFSQLGSKDGDYISQLFSPIDDLGLIVVSMWGDVELIHYRRKNSGYIIANNLHNLCQDGIVMADEDIAEKFKSGLFNEQSREKFYLHIGALREYFDFLPHLEEGDVTENTRTLFERLPRNVQTYFLMPSEFIVETSGNVFPYESAIVYNRIIYPISEDYDHIHLVRTDDFIHSHNERQSGFAHFDRMVYFRIYEHIIAENNKYASRRRHVDFEQRENAS
ncbi:HAD-IIIC family phosphatase [Asticcacaulis taihuensis]|uniref:HAD-IIIC family phosphatase n=1 Tax=Asticcacaulis taihuensis TaxID=260084 RepID=UPI003F7CB064